MQIYDISGVRVKTADSRFNNLHNQYELTLTKQSVVRLVDDTNVDASMPDAHFNFIPLRDVTKRASESFIGLSTDFIELTDEQMSHFGRSQTSSGSLKIVLPLFRLSVERRTKIRNDEN